MFQAMPEGTVTVSIYNGTLGNSQFWIAPVDGVIVAYNHYLCGSNNGLTAHTAVLSTTNEVISAQDGARTDALSVLTTAIFTQGGTVTVQNSGLCWRRIAAGGKVFLKILDPAGVDSTGATFTFMPLAANTEPRGSDVPQVKPLTLDPVLNNPIDVQLSKRVMKSSAGQQCCRINASIINGEISKGLGGLLDALTKPSGTVMALLAVSNRLRVITLAEAAATTAVLGEAFIVASAIELATLAKAAAVYETLSVVSTIISWVFRNIDTCGICCLARSLPQDHRRQRQRVKILRRL